MRGFIKIRSRSRDHVAIQTEDGDFAIALVPGRELGLDDEIWGDFINPGPKAVRRKNGDSSVAVYIKSCRLSPDAAKDYIASSRPH